MRISTSLMYGRGLSTINSQQADLVHIFQQVGTGRRILTPADDPLGAAKSINLGQTEALNARYGANRAIAAQNLGLEDNVLNTIMLRVQDIKTRIVEAGNGTYSDEERRTLANVLRAAYDDLFAQANATDGNGQYLFSGYTGDTPAYVKDGTGKVVWNGSPGERLIQVDQTRRLSSSDIGLDIFNRATPGSRDYITSADPANAGTALIKTPSINDPIGPNVGHDFTITFAGDPLAYTVEVTDADGNTIGETQGPFPYQSGTAIDMGGVQVFIEGEPQPGDVFQVENAQSADLDLFATLDAVIAALEVPADGDPVAMARVVNMLSTVNQKLDINHDNILTVRASVGARLNELEALDANGEVRNLNYKDQLSKLEDVDYYQAISKLQLREMALQAAVSAFQSIQTTTSLFNMRR